MAVPTEEQHLPVSVLLAVHNPLCVRHPPEPTPPFAPVGLGGGTKGTNQPGSSVACCAALMKRLSPSGLRVSPPAEPLQVWPIRQLRSCSSCCAPGPLDSFLQLFQIMPWFGFLSSHQCRPYIIYYFLELLTFFFIL